MQITICGGGNAAHVLAGILAARCEHQINVFTAYGDEAERWMEAIEVHGGILVHDRERTFHGRPNRASSDPAEVVRGSQIVLLALPAFTHESTLRQISPHLEKRAWLGAFPARGGFDWCAQDVLDGHLDSVTLFGLQTLPWACRIRKYAREIDILGTKAEVDLATTSASQVETIAHELGGTPAHPPATHP